MAKLSLCDSESAYQVLPDNPCEFSLLKKRNALDSLGAVIALTPYVAVLRGPEGEEFSIYSNGKILFRKIPPSWNEEKIKTAAERVYSALAD